MSTPAARIGDSTATGDTISGPGVSTVLIAGQPASIVGDQIVGGFCTGSIVMGSVNILIGGAPAARVASNCIGVNSASNPSAAQIATGAPSVLLS